MNKLMSPLRGLNIFNSHFYNTYIPSGLYLLLLLELKLAVASVTNNVQIMKNSLYSETDIILKIMENSFNPEGVK